MPSAAAVIHTHLGCKPHRPNLHDRKFIVFRSPLKDMAVANENEDYEIDDSKIDINDQLQEESCVANAWEAKLRILLYFELSKVEPALARQFLYWTARCLTGDQLFDAGCYTRSGAVALSSTGICPESYWPYDPSKVLTSPPEEAFFNASNNLLQAYYNIDSTGTQRGDDIETALKANRAVVFGTEVGQDLQSYWAQNADPNFVFNPPATSVGGHALVITGVRRLNGVRQFKVRNSWSKGWGLLGYFWASETYIVWDQSTGFYVGTLMKDLVL
jgi:C1A family cysteine protease